MCSLLMQGVQEEVRLDKFKLSSGINKFLAKDVFFLRKKLVAHQYRGIWLV